MKTANQKIAIALAIVGVSALNTGCGNGPMPIAVGTAPAAFAGGNACLSNVATGQAPMIGFTGNNILFNGNTIAGGVIPTSDNYKDEFGNPGLSLGGYTQGTMSVGGGAVAQGQLNGQGVDGTISMNISSFNQQGTQVGTTNSTNSWGSYSSGVYGNGQGFLANVTGAIQISQAKYEYLKTKLGMNTNYYGNTYGNTGYGMPMVQPQAQVQPQLCFTGVAISMSVAPSLNRLYGGRVYLTQGATTGQMPGYNNTSGAPISLQW